MQGTLYLVATPIGNLEDVTLRALRVLREVDVVYAEDTRRTRILLDRHGVAAKPLSLHAHNEAARTQRALEVLASGGSVALVSDAGTPLVSDPGERLAAAAAAAGYAVTAVPGPSAVLTALCVSGLATVPFTFIGFPPRRVAARRALFERLAASPETLVLFESPRRLAGTLRALAEVFGERLACVARELTKLHEEVARGTLSELAARFDAGARGEVTVVVDGAEPAPVRAEDLDAAIERLLDEGHSARDVVRALVRDAGARRSEVYARVLALRGDR